MTGTNRKPKPARRAGQMHCPVAPGIDHRMRGNAAGHPRQAGHDTAIKGGVGVPVALGRIRRAVGDDR